jgi:hypothetical protein
MYRLIEIQLRCPPPEHYESSVSHVFMIFMPKAIYIDKAMNVKKFIFA